MKLALFTVTYSGLFYAGEALSVEEQIDKARALGFDGLAIEAKRPVASPIDLGRADRARLKSVAADQGITLCAVESMSNFAGRYMEERENNLVMMRAVLEMASDLGVESGQGLRGMAGALRRRRGGRHVRARTSGRRRTTSVCIRPISGAGSARCRGFGRSPAGRPIWASRWHSRITRR